MGYRKDIDGLRAIAVLLVLFFHVEIPFFDGGFVGVDVFFTISGFLITGIILAQVEKGNFTFRRFYARRAARLLPAYLFMLAVVSVFSWFILAPIAFEDYLKTALTSTLSISNLYFLIAHSGYFSTASDELTLLHSWSLSVEEQFYFIMPLIIVLWSRIKTTSTQNVIFYIGLFASIFISYWLTNYNQQMAYFLVVSRAHEFLVGSLLAIWIRQYPTQIMPSKITANLVFALSLVVLLLSAYFIDGKSHFPGLLALIPCLATVGLIYAGLNQHSVSHKILGNSVLVYTGLLSYSLYLWHWPIVSLLKYVGFDFDWGLKVAIIAASFAFAYISYQFVETRFRNSRVAHKFRLAVWLYILPGAVFALLIGLSRYDILPKFADNQVIMIENAAMSLPEKGRELCHSDSFNPDADCHLGSTEPTSTKTILWGDSHANHFSPFIDEVAKARNESVRDITMGNCPPLLTEQRLQGVVSQACINKNKAVFDYIITASPQKVYLAASWYGYAMQLQKDGNSEKQTWVFAQFEQTIKKLQQANIEVVVLETLARSASDLSKCSLKQTAFPSVNEGLSCQFTISPIQLDIDGELERRMQAIKISEYIKVNSLICNNGLCDSALEGMPLYRDSNHLNKVGSAMLGKRYIAFSR